MKRRGPLVVLIALIGLLAWSITQVYQRRLARDLYPRYSSLRADPLGTRALHDAINELPGYRASRWVRPLHDLPEAEDRTVLLAGMGTFGFGGGLYLSNEDRRALRQIAVSGGRVVLAFQRMTYVPPWEETPVDTVETTDELESEEISEEAAEEEAELIEALTETELEEEPVSLGFSLDYRYWQDDRHTAVRSAPGRETDLPAELPWNTHAFLVPDQGTESEWQVLYRYGTRPVVMERRWGRGSIAVMTESFVLSNEALLADPRPAVVRWVLGGNTDLMMLESHLGVMEDPGVAALARRYGLTGAALVVGLWVLLFAWHRMAIFLPAPPPPAAVELTYEPTAGLEALLRRAVPPKELVPACLDEWRKTASEADRARVAEPTASSPVSEYNEVLRSLHKR